jgi:hypothetical protein
MVLWTLAAAIMAKNSNYFSAPRNSSVSIVLWPCVMNSVSLIVVMVVGCASFEKLGIKVLSWLQVPSNTSFPHVVHLTHNRVSSQMPTSRYITYLVVPHFALFFNSSHLP